MKMRRGQETGVHISFAKTVTERYGAAFVEGIMVAPKEFLSEDADPFQPDDWLWLDESVTVNENDLVEGGIALIKTENGKTLVHIIPAKLLIGGSIHIFKEIILEA